ncbi:MAG TPA: hypothetical protein VGF48_26170 [Thermoanaerobaculia bacterium]|jgi:hypothetical protein
MNINVTCYKGSASDSDRKVYQLDPMLKLSNVRDTLTNSGFLTADNGDDTAWRFVAAQSDSTAAEDALVNKSVENLVPLQGVLGGANQLICTNYLATRKPDLIGLGTDWFFNRYLGVKISLNNSDTDAKTTNASIKAFAPVMLTNVKPTSKNVVGIYDNVCVCVENSVVTFSLSSWGASGYQFYIGQDQGDPICDGSLNVCNFDTPNRYASTDMRRWAEKPQTIQIVGADSVGVTGGETLRFQKVTFRTRRITSYDQNGKTYASSAMPPARTGPAGLGGFRAQIADAASDFNNQRGLATAGQLETIPGDSIKPGGPVEGPPSQQNWGAPISNLQTDDWNQALGEVVVYFFVFNSWEQANRVINGYNAPDPNLWN